MYKLFKKIFSKPITILLDISFSISSHSTSNILSEINNILEYETCFETRLRTTNSFYIEKLEDFCTQNELNLIRELEIRKAELEHDISYFINIFIGVVTGVLATILYNLFSSKYFFDTSEDILNKSGVLNSLLQAGIFIIFLVAIVIGIPLIKFLIHKIRIEKNAEFELIDQHELNLINNILSKKLKTILSEENWA